MQNDRERNAPCHALNNIVMEFTSGEESNRSLKNYAKQVMHVSHAPRLEPIPMANKSASLNGIHRTEFPTRMKQW